MKLCGIYLITNVTNGKRYIGKSVDILTRWEQHIDAARLKKADYEFYQDMVDVQNFSFQILELCTIEELQEREQFFIKQFNSVECGYNQVMAIDLTKEESLLLDKKSKELQNCLKQQENIITKLPKKLDFRKIQFQTSIDVNLIPIATIIKVILEKSAAENNSKTRVN